jgi:hypothetical protein
MKKLLLTGIAVLFLATGAAQAREELLPGELVFKCDSDYDEVTIRQEHLASDMRRTFIAIESYTMTARKRKRYPVVQYDLHTHRLTLNGKPCRLNCAASEIACE